MTSKLLESYLDKTVLVSTMDGKVLTGTLSGIDNQCNMVLLKCVERIFCAEEGVEMQDHGLFLVRGDNVASIGDMDHEVDETVDWADVSAEPIASIRW